MSVTGPTELSLWYTAPKVWLLAGRCITHALTWLGQTILLFFRCFLWRSGQVTVTATVLQQSLAGHGASEFELSMSLRPLVKPGFQTRRHHHCDYLLDWLPVKFLSGASESAASEEIIIQVREAKHLHTQGPKQGPAGDGQFVSSKPVWARPTLWRCYWL